MKVRMTRIKGGQNLRTSTVEGELQGEVIEGSGVNIFGTPLEDPDANFRWVGTSPVVSLEELPDNKGYSITTYTGSEYLIEKL